MQRFKKKCDAGQKHIISEIFPWLPNNKNFEQWAVLRGSDLNHSEVGGGKVVPIGKLYQMIAKDVIAIGSPAGNAMAAGVEDTVVFTLGGTRKRINKKTAQALRKTIKEKTDEDLDLDAALLSMAGDK